MTGAEPKDSFPATSLVITIPAELQTQKKQKSFAYLKYR